MSSILSFAKNIFEWQLNSKDPAEKTELDIKNSMWSLQNKTNFTNRPR